MIIEKIKLSVVLCFLSFPFLYSQSCDISSFSINEELFNEDIVAYYLSAIDINSGTSYVSLFQYSIESSDPNCYQADYPSNINLILEFSMDIYSPSIGFNSSQNLFSGKIRLSNISSVIRVNNMDLDYSTKSVPGAEFSLFDWNGIDEEDSNFELIKNSILSSGKIPNGLYSFNFILRSEEGDEIKEINKLINVNEPEYIDLISPGGTISDTSINIVSSTFPVFTWNSDDCTSCETQIRICEFNPNNHSSLSEAINDVPNLPNTMGDEYYSINDQLRSFQYPAINSKSLEPGKLYVWQLKRIFQSTLGEEEILSDIYVYKIFNGYVQESNDLEILKLLLGEEQYNDLFSQNGLLSGYNEFEGNITLNGSEISISELNQIITKIQNGTITIEEILVE